MKNCKIIATYFGPRRFKEYSNVQNNINKFSKIINSEIHLDKGCDVDTLIINHDATEVFKDAEMGREYLNKLNGTKTKNGHIKVYHREWGEGASYGSFNWGFEQFRNEYFYWFFQEEDIEFILPYYYKIALDQFNKCDEVSFLCCWKYLPLSRKCDWPVHCHGGCGLSSSKYLNTIYSKFNCLPYLKEKMDLDNFEQYYNDLGTNSEVNFTNSHIQCGFKLKEIEYNGKLLKVYGSCGGIY